MQQLNEIHLSTQKYITSSCTIGNGIVSKNGIKLFENNSSLPAFLIAVYQHFQMVYPKFYKMDNLSKLGWLAAEVLLKDSCEKEAYRPEDVGVLLANANSSLDDDLKYFESIKVMASPSLFVYTLPNIVIGEICIRNRFKGEQAFYIQESFDADFMAQQLNYLLDNNILQACICGWVDVIGEEYRAALFLVEMKKKANAVLLSAEKMMDIYNN